MFKLCGEDMRREYYVIVENVNIPNTGQSLAFSDHVEVFGVLVVGL